MLYTARVWLPDDFANCSPFWSWIATSPDILVADSEKPPSSLAACESGMS